MTVRLPKVENAVTNLFFSPAVKKRFFVLKTRKTTPKPTKNCPKTVQIQKKIKNFRFLTNIFPLFRIYIYTGKIKRRESMRRIKCLKQSKTSGNRK